MGVVGRCRPDLARHCCGGRNPRQQLAARNVDPSALLAPLCGGGSGGSAGDCLQSWLSLAGDPSPLAAVVGGAGRRRFLGLRCRGGGPCAGAGSPHRWTGESRGGVFGHWFFLTLTRAFGRSVAYSDHLPGDAVLPLRLSHLQDGVARVPGAGGGAGRLGELDAAVVSPLARLRPDDGGSCAVPNPREGRLPLHRGGATAHPGGGRRRERRGLLTAHVGNWELAAGLLTGDVGDQLAIVAYEGERAAIAEFMKRAGGGHPLRIIDVGRDFLASLEMIRALREGTLLAVQGDRALSGETVRIPFLGREARFPVGPFMLAAVSGAPLIATFSLQVGPAAYRFFANQPLRLSFTPGQSREAQLRVWVEQYVDQLESLVRRYPYQWFNFYDFWDAAPPPASPRTTFATGEAA